MSDRLLIWSCWVPAALLMWMLWDISRLEGWGQWAAAPMLLLPVGLSLVMSAWSVVRLVALARAGRRNAATVLATAIAAIPLMWFGYRVVITA